MKGFLRLCLLVLPLFLAAPAVSQAADPNDTIYLDITYGRVVIQMRPDLAPKTCEQIRALTRRGFYNGVPFHRVMAGFMAQTGDPTGTGAGGSGHPLKAEFSDAKHVRGTVSMARTSDPDSADSQFFIVYEPAPQLDGKYTVWGEVVSGMEFVDKLKKGDPARNGIVVDPDKIVRMQVAADAKP
jgi:peptidylprolyl isomerase